MSETIKKNDSHKDENKDAPIKPAPETIDTKDPQEHMEGPISSLIQKIGEGFDSSKSKDEADEEKEKNM